jgi:hypothetical protein
MRYTGRLGTITLFLLLALGISRAIAEETRQDAQRRYVETHGSRRQVVEYAVVRSAGGFLVSSIGPSSTEKGMWVTGTGLVSWEQVDTEAGNDLRASRAGNSIHVTGTLKGKPVSRDIRVDSAPWYQIFGPALSDLLPQDAQGQEFWVVNPDDLSAHKMQVKRAGQEDLKLEAGSVRALRIHFSPAGALSPLWGADFWYRVSDGVWVYSRLPEGGGVTVSTLEDLGT